MTPLAASLLLHQLTVQRDMNSANFPEFSNERKTAYKSILRRSIEDALLQFLGLIPSRAIDDPIRTSVLGVYAGAPNPNTIVHLYHLTRASHDRSQLIEVRFRAHHALA